ncbi:hypothetical protein A3F65_00960 [Candidatus Saccharibacteria bacterium RIFCSPHIGHO2_12_FULL_47_16b]|nr:MAG: hypothetical protein A3F65_00960 [Candidatus Saccharibacteria bacterium RIFCSPHIGHO2_12_FULL_47_16b]
MNIVVNGLMTNYLKAGSGRKVVVCLHGWGVDSTNFARLIEKLQAKYTILALDLPGFGGSQEPPGAWGVENYASFVNAWLKKIGQKEIYALIGHSNGGAIAIALLGNGWLKSSKLVLLASGGIRDIYKMRRLFLKSGAKIAKLPIQLLPRRTRDKVRGRVYKTIGSDLMLLPELEPSYRKIISQDLQSIATKIRQPTLIIYGSGDRTTPVKYGQLFNDAIKGSRLEIIPQAGHFIHQEQAEKVAAMLEEFLGA